MYDYTLNQQFQSQRLFVSVDQRRRRRRLHKNQYHCHCPQMSVAGQADGRCTVAHCTHVHEFQFGVIASVVSANALAYSHIASDTLLLLQPSCSFVIKQSSDVICVIHSSNLQMGEEGK